MGAFGIDALYTPAGGDPVPVRDTVRRPATIVGFGETRIHAETITFEVRASEVASRRPGNHVAVAGQNFVVQGEPEGGRNWRTFDPNPAEHTWVPNINFFCLAAIS